MKYKNNNIDNIDVANMKTPKNKIVPTIYYNFRESAENNNNKKRYNINIGDIIETKYCGKYQILAEYLADTDAVKSRRVFKIKFFITGTIMFITLNDVIDRATIDPYFPLTHNNIACRGYTKKFNLPSHILNKLASIWDNIISRCYDNHAACYNAYGESGVTVCDRWLCFEYFVDDILQMPNVEKLLYTSGQYTLDKDKLHFGLPKNQKIYSPETCCIISQQENVAIRSKEQALESGKPIGNGAYYGIYQTSDGTYSANQKRMGHNIVLGTYKTPEAAAAIYNYNDMLFTGGYLQNPGIDSSYENRIKALALRNSTRYLKQMTSPAPPRQEPIKKQLYTLVNKKPT